MEFDHEVEGLFFEDPFEKIQLPPLDYLDDGFFNFSIPPPPLLLPPPPLLLQNQMIVDHHDPYMYNNDYYNSVGLHQNVEQEKLLLEYCNMSLPCLDEDEVFEVEPMRTCYQHFTSNTNNKLQEKKGLKRSEKLEMEEIQKYFDVPISKAAKEMNVGLTVLKKRCRELNIMRWPHRKLKSLKNLINNVKELGLTEEIVLLEEHKRLVKKLPDMELTDRTKKLRQACFKANYKKRRLIL